MLIFFIQNSSADIVRPTTFDERPACEKSSGMWRDFGNSCADKCEYKFQKYPYCSNGIIYSCDCGKNRCLFEDKCIEIDDYKKIHIQETEKEEKILQDMKIKRLKRAKKFQTEYTNKLAGIYGADPNYRDPYYDQRNRELPPNTFKSTNRTLIYNDIIKKRNDKTLAIQKKYQDELDALEKSGSTDQLRIDKLKKQLEDASKLKIIQPIVESIADKNLNSESDNSNSSDNKNFNNNPIVLKPINDNTKNSDLENSQMKNQSPIQNLINKTNEVLNLDNEVNADNSLENNADSLNDSNQSNDSSFKIPPVYIKQQNGEKDFKNSNIIDNKNNFPQFVN